MAGGNPCRKTAVEDGDGVVPEPPQQPPQPAGKDAGVLVVRDNLALPVDPEVAQRLPEVLGPRQRVASVDACGPPGEVPVEVGVDSPRDVRGCVHLLAPRRIVECEPAIDDAKRPVGQMRRQ